MSATYSRMPAGLTCLMYLASAFLLAACATSSPPAPTEESSAPTPASSTRTPAAVPPAAAAAPSQDSVPPAQSAALRTLIEQQNRLYAVAAPILMSNFALCKRNAQNVTGFVAKSQFSYPGAVAGAARAAIGERLQIMTVFPGSGAQQSGLLPGDVLLAVGETKVAAGPNAERDGAKLIEAAGKGRAAMVLTVLRGTATLTINLPLSKGCAFDIELGNTDIVNAYTDGRRVMLTRGMLNFARSDEDLALVVAKEIAHGALTQAARPGMRAMIDRLMLNQPAPATVRAPALQPYVPVSDATADKLALYMLARADGNVDNALGFWQRLAAQYPASVANGYTALHPATVYRVSVMKAVLPTIKLKKSNNLPLIP